MAESVQIAAFEGGTLRVTREGDGSSEVVLALPLNRLLVKMVRVPAANREDPVAFATPILRAMSPYPDEELTVSCETVGETEDELVVIAAAIPESSTGDIGAALDEGKYSVTRIDILALGQLRELWGQLNDGRGGLRRLVLLAGPDCVSLFVLDDDRPSAIRAISNGGDLGREVMLSLLEAEDFGGARPLAETVVVGDLDVAGLEARAPVRRIPAGEPSVRGMIERAADPFTLDVLPASWREVLAETRFTASRRRFLLGAGLVWVLIASVVFGGPVVFGFMARHQTALCKEHGRKYREVKDMQARVALVRRYSDHARGALEIMKAVSDRLPEGVELNSWNYKRGEGVRFSGEAPDTGSVYDIKDKLMALGAEGDSDDRVFADVVLTGPSATRTGKQRFDINCQCRKEEE
ncbi:MAG: hypothetical protein ACI4R9_03855 [Kiritimatiellia bacterium]